MNTHHVLGHSAPKLLTPKPWSALKLAVEGVACGRFHTVAWSQRALYTCGLNGGQLGQDRTCGQYISGPKLVGNLNLKSFALVEASDGATCFATTTGDVFLLHDYLTKKIASKCVFFSASVFILGFCF